MVFLCVIYGQISLLELETETKLRQNVFKAKRKTVSEPRV